MVSRTRARDSGTGGHESENVPKEINKTFFPWARFVLYGTEIDEMPPKSERELEEERQYIRAQRLAKRSRAASACVPCKAKKVRCSDYRPCSRCKKNPGESCRDFEDIPQIHSTPVGICNESSMLILANTQDLNCHEFPSSNFPQRMMATGLSHHDAIFPNLQSNEYGTIPALHCAVTILYLTYKPSFLVGKT